MFLSFRSPRPKLDRWLRERNQNYGNFGAIVGCSRETVRRYCLPFNDPKRRFPTRQLLKMIATATGGEITGHDFCEPIATQECENPVAQPEIAA